tara:strand:- start:25311 stop:26915 length:1605 start_codon:yes stop_codon:yes gene_type:complete
MFRLKFKNLLLILIIIIFPFSSSIAFEHEELPVVFLNYAPASFELAKKQKKPIFILISAEWCHWCKVFKEKTLIQEKVYTFLNERFINIFIDAEIRRDLYVKFQAVGLPYIVLMKPNGTVFYKYSGTLYANDFLGFLKSVYKDAKTVEEVNQDYKDNFKKDERGEFYSPPDKIELGKIQQLQNRFIETALENFDQEEYGVGSGIKYLMPATFLYLIEKSNISFKYVRNTLNKAVQKIYDPVDGGFFRYAETRRWETPHFEKMIDVNAAAILLLLKLNEIEKIKILEDVALKTVSYLSSKLFNSTINSFLSFQVADTSYYSLSRKERSKIPEPPVVKKAFTDRLSRALIYLLDSLKYLNDPSFEKKVKHSVDFLASMVSSSKGVRHYYSVSSQKWSTPDQLPDYVHLTRMFLIASKIFNDQKYLSLSYKLSDEMVSKFYNKKSQIFLEKLPQNSKDIEYLMELNSLIALTWLSYPAHELEGNRLEIVYGILTYFSGVIEIFEDSLWKPEHWRFLDKYIPFLRASEVYMIPYNLRE